MLNIESKIVIKNGGGDWFPSWIEEAFKFIEENRIQECVLIFNSWFFEYRNENTIQLDRAKKSFNEFNKQKSV